jgi:hypothetical protein
MKAHLRPQPPLRQPPPTWRPPGPNRPPQARLHQRLPRGDAPRSSHQLTFWASPCLDPPRSPWPPGGQYPPSPEIPPLGRRPVQDRPAAAAARKATCIMPTFRPRCRRRRAPRPKAPSRLLARARLLPCRSAVRPHNRECWGAGEGRGAGARLGTVPLPQQPPPPRRPAGPKTPPQPRYHRRLSWGEARRSLHQLTFWASPCPDASPETLAAGGSTPTLARHAPDGSTPSSGPLSCGCRRCSSLHLVQKLAPMPPLSRAPARHPAPCRLAYAWPLPYRSASEPLSRDCLRADAGWWTGALRQPAQIQRPPGPQKPP